MAVQESHGSLVQSLWKGFRLSFIGGALIAGVFTYNLSQIWLDTQVTGAIPEAAEIYRKELIEQNRALEESLLEGIERLRGQVQLLKQGVATPGSVIRSWATVEIQGDRVLKVGPLQDPGLGVNESGAGDADWVQQARTQIRVAETREQGFGAFVYKNNLIALVYPLQATESLVAVVDPMELWPIFKRFSTRSESGLLRTYIVSKNGNVLAHSQPNQLKMSYRITEVYEKALESLFQGERVSGTGEFRSMDQMKALTSYARLGRLPLALVVERVLPVQPVASPLRTPFFRTLPVLLLWIAAALGSVLLVTAWFKKWAERRVVLPILEGLAAASAPAAAYSEPLTIAATPTPEEQVLTQALPGIEARAQQGADRAAMLKEIAANLPASAKEQAVVAGPALESRAGASGLFPTDKPLGAPLKPEEERALVDQFEEETPKLIDPRRASHRLTALVARLCQSPVLYFAYHASSKSGVLRCYAGFQADEAPKSMAFPLSETVLKDIFAKEREGHQVSMVENGPLAQLLLEKTGISHFEAWAITGYGEEGRRLGKPTVLGVLVVLKAGFESAIRRETLLRVMRTTGTLYETTASSSSRPAPL